MEWTKIWTFLKVHKHNSTMELLNINLANDMLTVITKPTKITQSSAMLIDNIYLSKGINTDISDHLPCYVKFNTKQKEKERHARVQNKKLK